MYAEPVSLLVVTKPDVVFVVEKPILKGEIGNCRRVHSQLCYRKLCLRIRRVTGHNFSTPLWNCRRNGKTRFWSMWSAR